MSETMTAPFSKVSFLSSETLAHADETVSEVFAGMLGLTVEAVESAPRPDKAGPNERTAIVGFSGSLRGSCEIQLTSRAVQALASAMMGGATEEQPDDMLDDTIGEICNMIGGGWKDRIPALSSACTLSPPTVISGSDYKVHLSKPSVRIAHSYKFGEHLLCLTLHREDATGD